MLEAELGTDFTNGTGVCGNETAVTVIMHGTLTNGVWKFSITSEQPNEEPPDFPTFGVTGDVLLITDATPGIVTGDSEAGGAVINGPFCGWIDGTGSMTNAKTFTLGDSIDLDLLFDDFEEGYLWATLTEILPEGVFADSFETKDGP
jgi:hypothetical protein